MKRKITFLLSAFFALMLLTQPVKVMGQTKSTITITYSDTFDPALPTASGSVNTTATAHTDKTQAANSFTFKEKSIYKGSSNNYLMFVKNAGYIYNTQSLGTINSVAVTYSSGTSTEGKAGVYFGSSEQSTYTTSSNATIKGQSQTDTWTNNTSGLGFFQFSTSNKNVQVTQIVITYTSSGGGGTTPSNLALTDAPIALSFDLYNNSTPQVIDYTTSSTGAITVSSSSYITTSVNTETKKITVTPKAVTPSTQTITVNQAADATYAAGSVTFTVSISDSSPTPVWALTDIEDLTTSDIFVIVGRYSSTNYSMTNNGGSTRPTASSITISNNMIANANVTDNIKWNISGNETNGYVFYPNGSSTTWLYNTDENDGVKVGTGTTKAYTYNGGYLLIKTGTTNTRYLSYYSNQWRSYTNTNTAFTVTFYKRAYLSSIATPTLSKGTGTYIGTQNVTISCETSDVTIYYTLDGSDPTDSENEGRLTYLSQLSISTSTTLKAAAYKNSEYSWIAKAKYNIVTPLTTMQAIFDRATAVGTTPTTVYITFNDWVVSGVGGTNNTSAYLTDGTKGCVIYGASHGFSEGDVLSGTAQCKVELNNGAARITELTSSTTGLNVDDGGTVTPQTTTIAGLSGVNTGAVYTLRDLTYSSTNDMLSDGTNTIKLFNRFYDFSDDVENGNKYHITGVFIYYNEKEIAPRDENDIVLAANISDTDFSGLTTFTYVVDNGPSDEQSFDMIGENFVEELTVTALGDYEVSNDNTSYDESTTFTQDEGIILDQTLYVRLKADLGTGPHNGTLTFTSENMTTIVLNLEGTVSETATYNILLDDDIANGSIESNKTIAEEDDEVTLTAHPDQYYELSEWSVVEDDMTTPVSVSNNKFSMPASDVYVTATFSRIQYTITYSVQGNTSTIPSAQFNAGQVATLASATIPGQTFLGWSTSANSTTVVKNYIPTADATLYAVFGDLIDGDLSITVSTPNFPTSYGTANTFTEYTLLGKKFKIQQAYINSGKLQWRAGGDTNGTGTMYNSENFGRITSIVLVYNSSDTKKNFTIKGGTTENPTGGTAITPSNSGSTYTFDFSDYSFNYFVMANGANAGYLDQIIVNYEESHPFTGVTNITTNTTISDPIAASDRIVVTNGAVLTFKGTNNGTAANLVIEEGAQLYSNSPVAATFKKSVSAASTKAVDGWIAISSSVHDTDKSYESVYNVTSLISGSYDMFYYDEETKTWMNQKAGSGATGFTTMVRGQGYIYRNAAAKELAFTGVTNVGTFNEYQLSYNCSDTRVKGFNLVGNPYPHKIYKGVDFATTTDTLTTGYYVLEGNGSWTAKSDAIAIDVNQAILVEATEDAHEKYLQFKDKTKPAAKDAKSNNDNIQFIVENSEYSDVAYAWFDKGNGLKKINHRNASIPMLYINQNGTDYAIATMSDETQSFNLNFKAMTMGKYTLSFNATGNYDYLHVIDRLTGEDVDMLLEGKYSFIATPGDNEKRFIVKLAYIPNNSGNIDDNFAFQNGSDIIVSGNGELQIFDVTGRSVMTTTINGVETINVPTSGIYIFRLIGNEVKTQKIVVR